jgi:hypothetical protein
MTQLSFPQLLWLIAFFGIGLPLIPASLFLGVQANLRLQEDNTDPMLGLLLCLFAAGHFVFLMLGGWGMYHTPHTEWGWGQMVVWGNGALLIPAALLGTLHIKRSPRSIKDSILVPKKGRRADWQEYLDERRR